MVAMVKLHTSFEEKFQSVDRQINDDKDGIIPRLDAAVAASDNNASKISVLAGQIENIQDGKNTESIAECEELITSLDNQVQFLNAVAQKQDREITSLKKKILI